MPRKWMFSFYVWLSKSLIWQFENKVSSTIILIAGASIITLTKNDPRPVVNAKHMRNSYNMHRVREMCQTYCRAFLVSKGIEDSTVRAC